MLISNEAMSRSFLLLVTLIALLFLGVNGKIRHFRWHIQYTDVTRLCHTKSLVSVNGEFPGPTVYVRENDRVIVRLTNTVTENVTIHWHGVRQLLTAWSDGTGYITQCPIRTGESFTHNFTVVGQRGTLFWHAHVSWLRATLYGAIIILPETTATYPFSTPAQEFPILLGEWWNANVEDIIAQALASGGPYNISDALTINGQPGDLYNCSQQGTIVLNVIQGETYLLRIVNAAMNFQLFFAVANHSLTVVEADAEYTEPYTTDVILLAPGQTTNVLLTANKSIGQYYIAASVFSPAPQSQVPFPQTQTTAILNYQGAPSSSNLPLPSFPAFNDSAFAFNFSQSLQSQPYSSGFYYMDVPTQVDKDLFFTVGYSLKPCPVGQTCQGPNDTMLASSVNNVTSATPNISVLQAYYNQISGVYETDFPDYPLFQYNYTGVNPDDKFSVIGTKVEVLPFNTTVQIVFQDTATLFFEGHPMHLHGQSFYVVGSGFGNFDSNTDTANFNLVNPPARNTFGVPSGGWVAVRFRATNPGVWFLHCHLDIHQSWGMTMAFIVLNGNGPDQTLEPPPSDLPPC